GRYIQRVSSICQNMRAIAGVPDLHCVIAAARGDAFPIGRPRNRTDIVALSAKRHVPGGTKKMLNKSHIGPGAGENSQEKEKYHQRNQDKKKPAPPPPRWL